MQAVEIRPDSGKTLSDEHLEFIESGESEALDAQQILSWGIEHFFQDVLNGCCTGIF